MTIRVVVPALALSAMLGLIALPLAASAQEQAAVPPATAEESSGPTPADGDTTPVEEDGSGHSAEPAPEETARTPAEAQPSSRTGAPERALQQERGGPSALNGTAANENGGPVYWLDLGSDIERTELNTAGITVEILDEDFDPFVPEGTPEFAFTGFDDRGEPLDSVSFELVKGTTWTFLPTESLPRGFSGSFDVTASFRVGGDIVEAWGWFAVYDEETSFFLDSDPLAISPGKLEASGVTFTLLDYHGEPVKHGFDPAFTFITYDEQGLLGGDGVDEVDITERFSPAGRSGWAFTGDLPAGFSGWVDVTASFSDEQGEYTAWGEIHVTSYELSVDPYALTVPELAESGVTLSLEPVDEGVETEEIDPGFAFETWDFTGEGEDPEEPRDLTAEFALKDGTVSTYTAVMDEGFENYIDVLASFTAQGTEQTASSGFYVGEDDYRDITVTPEEIGAADFVDPEQGVAVTVSGFFSEERLTLTVATGPEDIEGHVLEGVADEDGVLSFRLHGLDASRSAAYIGEYTVEVNGAWHEEDGFPPLASGFAVVGGALDTPVEPGGEAAGDVPRALPRTGTELTALFTGGLLFLGGGVIVALSARRS